jgi:hypothetical protein
MNIKKLLPFFFILIIWLLSIIAYTSPQSFSVTENAAYFLSLLLAPSLLLFILKLCGFEARRCISAIRLLIAILFFFIFLGVVSSLVRFYLDYSFEEPFDRFIFIWGVAVFAVSAIAFIVSPIYKISKKTSEK